jgi:hypothetical protein
MTEKNETLNSLLGPSGAEVGCEECFDRLDEYVEAELAARDLEREFPGFRAHLVGCPACREDHESLRALVLADGA